MYFHEPFERPLFKSNFHFTAGCSVEIASMLQRLQQENKNKQEQIERLQAIEQLKEMVDGPINSGNCL